MTYDKKTDPDNILLLGSVFIIRANTLGKQGTAGPTCKIRVFLAGHHPRPFNNFKEIGYAPLELKELLTNCHPIYTNDCRNPLYNVFRSPTVWLLCPGVLSPSPESNHLLERLFLHFLQLENETAGHGHQTMIADLRVKGKDSASKLRKALYSMFDLDVLEAAIDHIGRTDLKTRCVF